MGKLKVNYELQIQEKKFRLAQFFYLGKDNKPAYHVHERGKAYREIMELPVEEACSLVIAMSTHLRAHGGEYEQREFNDFIRAYRIQ